MLSRRMQARGVRSGVRPWGAAARTSSAATVVLPTPPLPVTNTSGRSSTP